MDSAAIDRLLHDATDSGRVPGVVAAAASDTGELPRPMDGGRCPTARR